MSQIRIDAVGVTSKDIAHSVAFYQLLGFAFGEFTPEDQHVEALVEPGQTRLMIDSHALATDIIGQEPIPANHSGFAILCDSPAQVDEIASAVEAAGHVVVTPPWDAFWGQRYAIVADPDGYRVDLFAGL